jgi:hypothetical protein
VAQRGAWLDERLAAPFADIGPALIVDAFTDALAVADECPRSRFASAVAALDVPMFTTPSCRLWGPGNVERRA